MTTIAYKDGVMASDSCWADGGFVMTKQIKIYRTSVGGLIGSAGEWDSREVERFFDKIKTPGQMPLASAIKQLQCDYNGLLVLPKGKIYLINCEHSDKSGWSGGATELPEPFAAVGSGREFAFTAMSCGKSARDAVALACRYDINSRPPVHTLTLLSTSTPRKKT